MVYLCQCSFLLQEVALINFIGLSLVDGRHTTKHVFYIEYPLSIRSLPIATHLLVVRGGLRIWEQLVQHDCRLLQHSERPTRRHDHIIAMRDRVPHPEMMLEPMLLRWLDDTLL